MKKSVRRTKKLNNKTKKQRKKFVCMAMSWSVGAQGDHTWGQEVDTEKRVAVEKRGKKRERQKNKVRNTEIQA